MSVSGMESKPSSKETVLNGAYGPSLQAQSDGRSGHGNKRSIRYHDEMDSSTPEHSAPDILHISHGYIPFPMLVNRTTQQCWNDLADITTELADLQLRLQGPSPTLLETSKTRFGKTGSPSDELTHKKVRLLEFAQGKRGDFIKLLVLSNWSRRAAEVSRLVDLQAFVRARYDSYNDLLLHTASMKSDLIRAQTANPDLETSLETLLYGSVTGYSMLGFTPLRTLSLRKILKILRKINRNIHMRLLLHDSIPPSFGNYLVCDGRVKFHVPSEFEVDLSIAEETSHAQFFFVDMRFLFSPASHIPRTDLFDNLDTKVNTALRHSGLVGCFQFLHNLTLTYKLVILFKQAISLSRGHWRDNLYVDLARRTLIVQYWRNKPGPKSWIEIGISKSSRKGRNQGQSALAVPSLALRWFRENAEADPKEVSFDLDSLCMETVLRSVTSVHISCLLLSAFRRLNQYRLYVQNDLEVAVSTSDTEPGDCWLEVQLTKTKRLKAMIDPFTGLTILRTSPPSMNKQNSEPGLNKQVTPEDLFSHICRLRSAAAKNEIQSRLQLAGWQFVESHHGLSGVRQFTSPGASSFTLFSRHRLWQPHWFVVFTNGFDGDRWWIVSVQDGGIVGVGDCGIGWSRPFTLNTVHRINGVPVGLLQSLNFSSFFRLTNALSGILELQAHLVLRTRSHRVYHRPFELSNDTNKIISRKFRPLPSLNLHLRLSNVAQTLQIQSSMSANGRQLIKDTLHLSFHGVDELSSCAIVTVQGHLNQHAKGASFLNGESFREIIFSSNGNGFAMCFLAPIGQPVMLPLCTQLQQLDLVISMLKSLCNRKLVPLATSLTKVDFAYGQSSGLGGIVRFRYSLPRGLTSFCATDLQARKISLLLAKAIDLLPQNPHHRIREFLTSSLNNPREGFNSTMSLLLVTLPLLESLNAICVRSQPDLSTPCSIFVLPRSASAYQIYYSSLGIQLHIRLCRRRDQVMWILHKAVPFTAKSLQLPEGNYLVNKLFSSQGDGWQGLKSGAIAEVGKVKNLITALHCLLHNHLVQHKDMTHMSERCISK
ncbi:hypothetical protein VTO42DRAFT_2577 [Malbranchea cinnamomea]